MGEKCGGSDPAARRRSRQREGHDEDRRRAGREGEIFKPETHDGLAALATNAGRNVQPERTGIVEGK